MMRTLPLIDELEAALSSGTNTRRIEMLTRITDLFVGGAARYSEDQIGVFDDVMVRLMQHHRGQGARQAGASAGADRQRSRRT